jgi:hypothetical protein
VFFLFAAALLVAPLSGCTSLKRSLTRTFYVNRSFEKAAFGAMVMRRPFDFASNDVASSRFWGPAIAGKTEVYYQRGLETEAERLARDFNALIETTQERIGFEVTYGARFYLFRVNEVPRNIRFMLKLDRKERVFTGPVFLEEGKDLYADGLWPFPAHPYLAMHELVEISLIDTDRANPVLPDLHWGPFFVRNYTRWFREGFANYAGQVASDATESLLGLSTYDERLGWGAFSGAPYSSLSLAGGDLFRWHQYHDRELSDIYYDAAVGLFLLVRERYGEEAVREIVGHVNELQWADGKAIAAAFEGAVGTPPERLAEDLAWPHFGMHVRSLSPAGAANRGILSRTGLFVDEVEEKGSAAKAGLFDGDVLKTANGRDLRTLFDFEVALFDVMPAGDLVLEVERQREIVQVTLSLAEADRITAENRRALLQDRLRRRKDSLQWKGFVGGRLYKSRPKKRTPEPSEEAAPALEFTGGTSL